MKTVQSSSKKEIPSWANECISLPRQGVLNFLSELCKIGNAPYAHIRIKSRSGKFYQLAESIGPYKDLGWQRQFNLIDINENNKSIYQLIDYKNSKHYEILKNKFNIESPEHQYLDSLDYGYWFSLKDKDIELGYAILSWASKPIQKSKAVQVKNYIKSFSPYIPLVYQACREIITERNIANLSRSVSVIYSAEGEYQCYDFMADACIKFWGDNITVYIGKIVHERKSFELVSVAGYRANEAKKNIQKQIIPINQGIFGYLISNESPLISYSTSNDNRFLYHSMREDGKSQGSAIATKIGEISSKNPIAFISVEHELERYFDYDDLRYLNEISNIGYKNITIQKNEAEKRSRDIDALFTQIAHDIVEPLQALVADAEVLKYETANAEDYLLTSNNSKLKKYLSDTLLRTTNFLEEALILNKTMWRHLESGMGKGIAMEKGIIRIYPFLNKLLDTWRSRAESQGIEIKSLYDSLRSIKISCDEAELKSALGHLIGNTIKYSFGGRMQYQGNQPKYGRYISIVGRLKMDMAIIEFQNYGIGILPSEINLIKEKYYRGRLAIKEGKSGTGRGLWQVSNFLESIGGYLTITSTPQSLDTDGPYSTSITIHLPITKS